MAHTLKPGDVLYATWGYNMTNVSFFEVTRATRRTVVLVERYAAIVEHTGYLSGTSRPADERVPHSVLLDGPEARRVVRPGDRVRLTDYAWAYRWDGRPIHFNHCD